MTKDLFLETLTKQLKKKKYTILKPTWGDGYFVFDMGKNSVLHFNVKEIKGWKFAIWFEEGSITVFTQPENNIDKFKPSRSTYIISENKSVEDFTEEDMWSLVYHLEGEILSKIHYDRIVAWYYDYSSRYPRNWLQGRTAYRKHQWYQFWKNFTGDVWVQHTEGWLSSIVGHHSGWPFKCIYVKLKYGKKVVWNKL